MFESPNRARHNAMPTLVWMILGVLVVALFVLIAGMLRQLN
jgi:hypothetical protein